MKVVVFGANGRVGKLVVADLLAHGHQVTAFVHSRSNFDEHASLGIVKGDVHDSAAVKKAIIGADAVVSTLGSWGTSSKNILSSGMRTIIPAMQGAHVRRIITLTGAEAECDSDRKSLIHRLSRLALNAFAGKILKDGEEHMRLLEQSDLDWTVMRSPVMNERGPADYKLSDKRPPLSWTTINRQAVAKSLVALTEDRQYVRQAPYIRRRG